MCVNNDFFAGKSNSIPDYSIACILKYRESMHVIHAYYQIIRLTFLSKIIKTDLSYIVFSQSKYICILFLCIHAKKVKKEEEKVN